MIDLRTPRHRVARHRLRNRRGVEYRARAIAPVL
jgi:hypothetical protein